MLARNCFFAGLFVLGLSALGQAQQPWITQYGPMTGGWNGGPMYAYPPGNGLAPGGMMGPGMNPYMMSMGPPPAYYGPQPYRPYGPRGRIVPVSMQAPIETEGEPVAEPIAVGETPDVQGVPYDGTEGNNGCCAIGDGCCDGPVCCDNGCSLLAKLQCYCQCHHACHPPLCEMICSRLCQLYVRADVMMLRRSNPATGLPGFGIPLVLQDGPAAGGGTVVQGTENLKFANGIGSRYTVGMTVTPRTAIEGSYWLQQNWVASNTVSSSTAFNSNNLHLPNFPTLGQIGGGTSGVLGNSHTMSTFYKTIFWNAEANVIQQTSFDRFYLLAGFRTMYLNDYLNTTGFAVNAAGAPTGAFGTVDLGIKNRLYGGQLGLTFRQNIDIFSFDVTGKWCVFDNSVHEVGNLYNPGGTGIFATGSFVRTQSNSVFLQDYNANVACHLTSNLSLRAGYNVLMFNNLALVPSQIAPTFPVPYNKIVHDSYLLMFGLNGGIDFRF